MKFSKIKLVIRIVLIAVVFVVLGVIITVGAMNVKSISKQYHELSNKPVSSARQFKIPFGYVTVRADGTIDITFADSIEYAQVNPEVDEVEFDGATPDDDRQQAGPDWEGDGDAGSMGFLLVKKELTDEEFVKAVINLGFGDDIKEAKAYGLLACYRGCQDAGMSLRQALGLMACACCEGYPGLIQYHYWLGNENNKSTRNNPIILNTYQNISWAENGIAAQYTGGGSAQWTTTGNSLRLAWYADKCRSVVDEYGEGVDYKYLWQADRAMYAEELSGNYRAVAVGSSEHTDSLEDLLCYEYMGYEAGTVKGYKGSNFEDYVVVKKDGTTSTTHVDNLNERYEWMKKLEAALRPWLYYDSQSESY